MLTPKEILQKMGLSRVADCGTVVDTVGDYSLIDMSPLGSFLLKKNPSGTWHIERVSDECTTVEQAINWRDCVQDMMLTPKEILQIRKGMGMTQKEFAAFLNVSPEIVYRWEKGRRHPNTRNHVKLLALKER